MSYKNKKLKKSKLGRLKYRLGQVKSALLRRAAVLLEKIKLPQLTTEEKGDVVLNIPQALETLRRYDRLSDNPDMLKIEQAVVAQLEKEGKLSLCVFVCPKFDPKALFTSEPEKYMPVEVSTFGLFEDRIAKIISLKDDLMKAGVFAEINLMLGDNDAEEYIFPFIGSLKIDPQRYRERQSQYRLAFEEKCKNIFGEKRCVVWSLAEWGIVIGSELEPVISADSLEKELIFFGWLFSSDGPYLGGLKFSEKVLVQMAIRKYQLYGAQGKFLEMLGGILLQTEGPGVWLERTQMLRCTGSSAIPAIYPWIRKEER